MGVKGEQTNTNKHQVTGCLSKNIPSAAWSRNEANFEGSGSTADLNSEIREREAESCLI